MFWRGIGEAEDCEVKISRYLEHEPEVPSKALMKLLGCPPDRRPSGRLRRQIEKATRGVTERMACRLAYRRHTLRVERSRVFVGNRLMLRSVRLAQALRSCYRVYAYVVTLGREVDSYIDHWMDRRPDFGVVVDAVASVAADSMVDRVEEVIAEHLPPSEALSLPFSAGYCDWPVSEQAKVFSLLPEDSAGVDLSDDWMMSPRKSISGLFGVGPVSAVTQTACPCSSCMRRDCGHRRRPYSRNIDEGNDNRHSDEKRWIDVPRLRIQAPSS